MKPSRVVDAVRRRILLHRRLLGATCVALAAWVVTQAATAPPPATDPVWTAAHDLPSGSVLGRDDLTRSGYAPGTAPERAVRSLHGLVGRTLATPLGRGEPVTAAHLVGADRLDGYPGRAAVAVRIPDPAVVALLTPGQRVGLVATDPQSPDLSERLVDDAAVLAVPGADRDDAPTALPGRLVVLAVPEGQVDRLAAAATTRYLSVVWSR